MYAAVENSSGSVPAFLIKLWTLVEDPTTDELIHWDSSGTSFHVYDQQRFSREILPLYFKHNNIASFIRQLNMYGFRKVTHIDQGGLKIEKDDLQFQHQYFQRGERDMLQFIKRKVSAQGMRTTDHLVTAKPDEVSRVLSEMKQVRSKQESMDENLEYIKRENKLLWREVALLRQKHHKQQQIVNKLIQFLVSLVSSNRTGLSIPAMRRVPLAINDVSQLVERCMDSNEASVRLQAGNNMNDTKSFFVVPASPDGIKDEATDVPKYTIESNSFFVVPASPDGIKDEATDVPKYTIESPKIGDYHMSPTPSLNGPIIHELTDSPQTILVPVSTIDLVNQGVPCAVTLQQQNVNLHPTLTSTHGVSQTPNKGPSIVLVPTTQSQSAGTAVLTLGHQSDPVNFLMSPKIEAAPSLEDALNFGFNVPTSSHTVSSHVNSPLQVSSTGPQQRVATVADLKQQLFSRKRKSGSLSGAHTEAGGASAKQSSPTPQTVVTDQIQPMLDDQAESLTNIIMANSDLNSAGSAVAGVSNSGDSSLAVASSKDVDEFTISSDQLDLLSSDLDGLKGILQDQYKVDPSFLMELFDSSNPWPMIPEKDLDELKNDREKDEAGTSELDHGNITGTELVEYNSKEELFPELMDDNMMGDIDDID